MKKVNFAGCSAFRAKNFSLPRAGNKTLISGATIFSSSCTTFEHRNNHSPLEQGINFERKTFLRRWPTSEHRTIFLLEQENLQQDVLLHEHRTVPCVRTENEVGLSLEQ